MVERLEHRRHVGGDARHGSGGQGSEHEGSLTGVITRQRICGRTFLSHSIT
jgi:hypothetical protein